ncbi:acetate--CoA ligase, partial [Enterococcus faecalis]
MTHLLDYQPLNLYTNYQEAAEKSPTVPIIFDDFLPDFPPLGLETTYAESHQE